MLLRCLICMQLVQQCQQFGKVPSRFKLAFLYLHVKVSVWWPAKHVHLSHDVRLAEPNLLPHPPFAALQVVKIVPVIVCCAMQSQNRALLAIGLRPTVYILVAMAQTHRPLRTECSILHPKRLHSRHTHTMITTKTTCFKHYYSNNATPILHYGENILLIRLFVGGKQLTEPPYITSN